MREPDNAGAEPVDEEQAANARWNFAVNFWDITFISLGLSLVSRDTIMPVLASELTDSKLAIGMIPAIFACGHYLPQLFSANISERMVFKKPFVARVGFYGERLPYLMIALVLCFFAVEAPLLALCLFLFLIGIASSSDGLATPAWFDMIAKVIPVRCRGIWSGLGHGLGAIISVLVLYFVALPIVERVSYPHNFVLLFLMAFAAVMVSWAGLVLTREPPSQQVKQHVSSAVYFRALPHIMRQDANYAHFVLSRGVIQSATMAGAFYMVFGTDDLGIDAGGVVVFTMISVSSVAVMNIAWGMTGDRFGHKIVLTLAAFCLTVASLLALLAKDSRMLALAFVLLGTYVAAEGVSGLNVILEFCAPEDRPTYIGLTNTLLAPIVTMAPVIGALLVSQFGYRYLFASSTFVSAIGGLLLLVWVKEPRGRASAAALKLGGTNHGER